MTLPVFLVDGSTPRIGAGLLLISACSAAAPDQAQRTSNATVFEGARLIVGDGNVIENATFVVGGTRVIQAGRMGDVREATPDADVFPTLPLTRMVCSPSA